MPDDNANSPEDFATPLRRLQYLMMGCLDTETDESREQIRKITESNKLKKKKDRRPIPIGYAKGSECHKAAEIFNIPRIDFNENDSDTCSDTTIDMFIDEEIEENMARFIILEDELYNVFPMNLSDETPDDSYDPDVEADYGIALAWDDRNILTQCPRGVCCMSRAEWNDGYRRCRMC